MRMNHPARFWIWPLCLCVAAAGCNAREEPAAPLAVAPAASPEEAVQTIADSPGSPEVALAESAQPRVVEFSPPFPHRLERELFEPPKRAQSMVRRDDHGETVELKGFVHVDQPRVVLSIDGVISPIAEGGEKYGVQVISIHPPSVVLQRGRNRWIATLE